MFFSKKKKINEIDMSRLPQHIGIIMDGNGRWAKKEVCREVPDTVPERIR